jgi:hypothetical protein
LTTNTQYDPSKDTKLITKVSSKWAHPSGFTLEKLEVGSNGAIATETSLVGAAPGLKLEFKGNDTNKGDLSLKYTPPAATITADVDALNFSKASASVTSGFGNVTAGASADFNIAKTALDKLNAGMKFSLPKLLDAYLTSKKTFTEFSGGAAYVANKDVTVAADGTYAGSKFTGNLALMYKCNPATTMKVKASSAGVLNASVKHALQKKCSLVGAAEVPPGMSSVKFGLGITLG